MSIHNYRGRSFVCLCLVRARLSRTIEQLVPTGDRTELSWMAIEE